MWTYFCWRMLISSAHLPLKIQDDVPWNLRGRFARWCIPKALTQRGPDVHPARQWQAPSDVPIQNQQEISTYTALFHIKPKLIKFPKAGVPQSFWTTGPQSHPQRASKALYTLITELYLKNSRQLIRFHKLATSCLLWPQRPWTTVWESVALGLWTRANQAWKKTNLETSQRKLVIWGIFFSILLSKLGLWSGIVIVFSSDSGLRISAPALFIWSHPSLHFFFFII